MTILTFRPNKYSILPSPERQISRFNPSLATGDSNFAIDLSEKYGNLPVNGISPLDVRFQFVSL